MDTREPNDDLLPLLPGICEDFFASTSPAVRSDVDAQLRARGISGGPGWLIDMLALTRQRLELPADHREPDADSAREGGSGTHRH
jgi:hypothetical protein